MHFYSTKLDLFIFFTMIFANIFFTFNFNKITKFFYWQVKFVEVPKTENLIMSLRNDIVSFLVLRL